MTIRDKIPEVLGRDQDGREIKASDYRGRKIVLYSYPKANTSGCTAEACSLQSHKCSVLFFLTMLDLNTNCYLLM